MVLPLYLALSASEFSRTSSIPEHCCYMACHFSPYTEGISNIPESLPEGSILILNDRMPCQGHSAVLVAQQLANAAERLHCESVLLDFQRPPDVESFAMVETIMRAFPLPVVVTEAFAANLSCPVFLSPSPLHTPLAAHLAPWHGREIWLEAALCQERITVTADGSTVTPIFPTQQLESGFYEKQLRCQYQTTVSSERITFTLFDTPESLCSKLEHAQSLGVARAVGLYQELGEFFR